MRESSGSRDVAISIRESNVMNQSMRGSQLSGYNVNGSVDQEPLGDLVHFSDHLSDKPIGTKTSAIKLGEINTDGDMAGSTNLTVT